MRQLCIFLSLFIFFCSCKTKQVTKESERIEINSEVKESEKVDNHFKSEIEKFNFSQQENLFKSYFDLLDFQYVGTSQDDKASILFQQTTDGLKMDLQGLIQANYKSENKSEESKKINIDYVKFDSIIKQNLNAFYYKIEQNNLESESKYKQVDITGLQSGVYFVILVLGIVLIFIVALFIFLNKRLKAINLKFEHLH